MDITALSSRFDSADEDWTGLSDQKKRKQLQNRINQRAHRTRKLRAQLAALQAEHRGKDDREHLLRGWGTTIVLNSGPSFNLYQDASLSPVEWEILTFVARAVEDLWERRLLEIPVMRHSVILVTCLDLEFLTGRDYTPIRLRNVNATIRQIVAGLGSDSSSSPKSARKLRQDEILFAVMALAKTSRSTSLTPAPGVFGLFTPPFPFGLQFLNLWGQDMSDRTHCMAMQHITRSRDKLIHNMGIETPGFAEALYQFDLLESAKTLSRPWMPIPTARLDVLRGDKRLLRGETAFQARLIQAVPRISCYGPLLDILCDLHMYCSWIQTLQDEMEPELGVKLPYPDSIRDFTMLRDTIEHRLLTYETTDNSMEEQICWTVALIFTHCVIFPLPNRGPLETLLGRLRRLLRSTGLHEHGNVDETFLAWVSMIGAMACSPTEEDRRQFFLECLVSYTAAVPVASWFQLKGILQRFLWLDRACDTGGQAIWEMLPSFGPSTEDGPHWDDKDRSNGSLVECV
ncbi:hypothetical protein H2200_005959 [Cladophialophora chaetospira]|uniref:BZIP domain-containing protein n=1 Tax=Cladophialophora chaetospira TaxID=386627 RepID=A0AA39CIL6_9EURO|nr:hypothetical protein H2200_005959 [Cladophialophora chaetospira]